MSLRELYESIEENNLSPKAAKSSKTLGRENFETKCSIRTEYQRDRDRIVHSKSFRRLMHKTQVFLSPEGDHYRTRLTHTLEVSQISRTIARGMMLNEDLTEAIAMGHDLGHTPFGHCGERTLNALMKAGFHHNVQSLKVVEVLESKNNSQYGLNLTKEVRDGILNHTGDIEPITLEGQIVKISDRIAYINHDIDDAVRAGIISEKEFPQEYLKIIGYSHGERINTMITDIITNSNDKERISMSDNVYNATIKLREFLFKNVYLNKTAKSEEHKAEFLIKNLFNYYMDNFEKVPRYYLELKNAFNYTEEEIVKDYISGMTDRYAIKVFKEIFVPLPWDK